MLMKAKRLLLLAALAVALLTLGFILPASVAASEDEPTNSVEGNCTINMLPDTLIGFTIDAQQSGNETLEGVVLQKIMRTTDPDFANAPTVREATDFTIEPVPWAVLFALSPTYLNYSSFHEAGDSYTWPADLPVPELLKNDPAAYDMANIADFVVALPTTGIFPPEWGIDPMPHRYVVIDFGEPGRKDLVQIYGWVPIPPIPAESGFWLPQLMYADDFYSENPQYVPGDPIPVLKGNFQVEVGTN